MGTGLKIQIKAWHKITDADLSMISQRSKNFRNFLGKLSSQRFLSNKLQIMVDFASLFAVL